jgi:hypothetical protein
MGGSAGGTRAIRCETPLTGSHSLITPDASATTGDSVRTLSDTVGEAPTPETIANMSARGALRTIAARPGVPPVRRITTTRSWVSGRSNAETRHTVAGSHVRVPPPDSTSPSGNTLVKVLRSLTSCSVGVLGGQMSAASASVGIAAAASASCSNDANATVVHTCSPACLLPHGMRAGSRSRPQIEIRRDVGGRAPRRQRRRNETETADDSRREQQRATPRCLFCWACRRGNQ